MNLNPEEKQKLLKIIRNKIFGSYGRYLRTIETQLCIDNDSSPGFFWEGRIFTGTIGGKSKIGLKPELEERVRELCTLKNTMNYHVNYVSNYLTSAFARAKTAEEIMWILPEYMHDYFKTLFLNKLGPPTPILSFQKRHDLEKRIAFYVMFRMVG